MALREEPFFSDDESTKRGPILSVYRTYGTYHTYTVRTVRTVCGNFVLSTSTILYTHIVRGKRGNFEIHVLAGTVLTAGTTTVWELRFKR